MNNINMENRLREFRERVAPSMSQQRLADLANTSQPQIDRLEKGERKLTLEWAERLARHLNCSAADLLFSKAELAQALIEGGPPSDPLEIEIMEEFRHLPDQGKLEAIRRTKKIRDAFED